MDPGRCGRYLRLIIVVGLFLTTALMVYTLIALRHTSILYFIGREWWP